MRMTFACRGELALTKESKHGDIIAENPFIRAGASMVDAILLRPLHMA